MILESHTYQPAEGERLNVILRRMVELANDKQQENKNGYHPYLALATTWFRGIKIFIAAGDRRRYNWPWMKNFVLQKLQCYRKDLQNDERIVLVLFAAQSDPIATEWKTGKTTLDSLRALTECDLLSHNWQQLLPEDDRPTELIDDWPFKCLRCSKEVMARIPRRY